MKIKFTHIIWLFMAVFILNTPSYLRAMDEDEKNTDLIEKNKEETMPSEQAIKRYLKMHHAYRAPMAFLEAQLQASSFNKPENRKSDDTTSSKPAPRSYTVTVSHSLPTPRKTKSDFPNF